MAGPNLALAFNLPPERAVEYFTAKGLRISGSWRDMAARAHAGAFTVAGVLKGEVLQDVRNALEGALADGQTYDQFLRGLMPKLKAQGWWGIPHDPATGEVQPGRAMTPHRLRTVYQTNLQSAYMAGRYKAQLENADRRPYWKYVAILDSRTRPRHRALNGRVFRWDDPIWGVIYPPNGYNCRCRVVALSQDEFTAGGYELSNGGDFLEERDVLVGKTGELVRVTGYKNPSTGEWFAPDPGFDSNPGAGWGRDIALARRVQELKSPEIRRQVWQALNNSPERAAAWRAKVEEVLSSRGSFPRPGQPEGATVLGFVDDRVAAFARSHAPDSDPVRVLAMPHKRLLHADSGDHLADGIALTADQYAALPGVIAKPDRVYWDTEHRNIAFVRWLEDGSAIYVPVTPDWAVKKVGRIDAAVNAYRIPAGEGGVGRFANGKRFIAMSEGG